MITVKVNGSDIGFDRQDAGTIADVVGTVSQNLDTDLRIVSVRYNGEDITGRPDRHMQAIQGGQFELETAKARDMALETLQSIQDFHTALVNELERTSEEFRSGSFEKANELMLRCLDGLQVLIKTTHSVTSLLQLQLHEVEAGDAHLEDLTHRAGEMLNEMIDALENQDGVLLADLIEYELQVLLEDWKAALDSLVSEGQKA